MNVRSSCPCCSQSMLLHLTSRRSYWLCNHCRIETPHSDPQKNLLPGKGVGFSSSLKAAISPLKSEKSAIAV